MGGGYPHPLPATKKRPANLTERLILSYKIYIIHLRQPLPDRGHVRFRARGRIHHDPEAVLSL